MARNKQSYKYQIDIGWSQEDECYVVNVPELKGCKTHGETIDEAVVNSQEAIRAYLASLKKRGIEAPVPLAEQNFSGKIPLRIDPVLHRDLAVKAKLVGKSLNKFIENKLKKSS